MGLLTPEDGQILTKAIRDALPEPAPPPRKPSLRQALLRLAAAVGLGFVLALFVWWFLGFLLGTHVPLPARASSLDPDRITHISMSGGKSGWSADQITTDRVTVLGPTADLRISLPIPVARCSDLARALEVTCSDGVITGIELPAELTFSAEVATGLKASASRSFDLDRLVDADEPENRVLGFLTRGGRVDLSVTVSEPTMLTISAAASALPPIELRPASGGLPEERRIGLELVAGPAHPLRESNIVLEHVTAIEGLGARGASGELQGFVGKVIVFGSGTTIVDPATTVSILGDGSESVLALLSIGSASMQVQLNADPAISVKTDEGELLPTRYGHRPQFWGPVVAALMGGLVLELTVGQLGAFAKGFLDKIGNAVGA